MVGLSSLQVEGPDSDTLEGPFPIEPYTLDSIVSDSRPGNRCDRCVEDTARFCRRASIEEMEHAVRRLKKNRLPVPPCLKDFE